MYQILKHVDGALLVVE